MRSLRQWSYYPITTRELEVLRVSDVSPGMRRVTLGGPGLAAHLAPSGHPVAAFRSEGFDDEFKIFLRHPDEPVALVPRQLEGVLDWGRDPHLVARTYTVRRWDPAAGEVDLDLVLHGDGPAVRWATSVMPGDRLQVAGPKMSGSHPAGADWCLVAGHETALPAIARWLEEFPDGARAQVFIALSRPEHRQRLVVPDGVQLTWLVPDATQPQQNLLLTACQGADWWPGTVFAWAAGEATALAPLRRWLRREKGLAAEQVEVTGYWRAGAIREVGADGSHALSGGDEASSRQDVEDPAADAEGHLAADASGGLASMEEIDVHEMAGLVLPVAIRVAASLGLGGLLAGEPRTLGDLARDAGVEPLGLGKLLRLLTAHGLVAMDRNGYRWTQVGAQLDDDWLEDQLRLDGPASLGELGVLGLLAAVRRGQGSDPSPALALLGLPAPGREAQGLADRLAAEAEESAYLAEPLAASALLEGINSIRVAGPGADELARQVVRRRPGVRVHLLLPSGHAQALGDDLPESVLVEEHGLFEVPAQSVGLTVLAGVLDQWPDDAAVAVLRTARAGAERVALVGEALDDASLDEDECLADVVGFARGGAGLRTAAERDLVVARSGLRVVERTSVGWGFDVCVLA